MKKENTPSALIIYLSMHGTTRKVIDAFDTSLLENGISAVKFNLCSLGDESEKEKLYSRISSFPLIVLGSPTYFHHAPPLFTDFVKKIPSAVGDQAIAILSTFGGVSSGVIQFDFAKIMHEKKYRLIGGIKVLTEHCLTFQDKKPFAAGHPDESDLSVVRDFGKEIARRLEGKGMSACHPVQFRDKPFLLNVIDDRINKLENFSWAMPGITIRKEVCTGCGICVKKCSTRNIHIDQIAIHGKSCIYCYSCVRNCPTGAARAFLKPVPTVIRWLAQLFSRYEEQITRQVV
ncbi:MAG: EFR1 family ferrodoxin [Syntrophaceae bacterium]|nr:EFR1 family ferrodoxin [Syntrophaceae bacterium]